MLQYIYIKEKREVNKMDKKFNYVETAFYICTVLVILSYIIRWNV
jgi:hypothetical protein